MGGDCVTDPRQLDLEEAIAAVKARERAQSRPVRMVDRDKFVGERPSAYAATPWRVLTLIDKLYKDDAIDVHMWAAARELQTMVLAEWPRSEGVPSYGDSRAPSSTTKADRAGERLTGFKIRDDGTIETGKRKGRGNARHLEDAIFAVCGLHDNEGNKVFNPQEAELLLRIVVHSEAMPTLKGITLEFTSHYGAKSKQAPPYALGRIHALLGRLAKHLRHTK